MLPSEVEAGVYVYTVVEECTVGDVYEIKEAGWNRAHWVSLVGLWGLWFLQSLLFFTNSAKAIFFLPVWILHLAVERLAVEHRRRCCSKTDILRAVSPLARHK